MADLDFFETVACAHRASEGATCSRLKLTAKDEEALTELMRWMPPPDGIQCARTVLWEANEEASMTKINMLANDLAKGSFQVCGVGADGAVVFKQAMSRPRLHQLLAEQPPCIVVRKAQPA